MKYVLLLVVPAFLYLLHGCSANNNNPSARNQIVNKESSHEKDHEAAGHDEQTGADHTVMTLKKEPFSFVIKAGGMIMTDSKGIEIITAKSSGIVKLSEHFLFPGVKTVRGQHLFTISGSQLADDNTELNFRQIQADFEKARLNYERAQSLIADRIITQEHFLDKKNEFEKARNEYNNLNASFKESGNVIYSPANGYIREIYVTEGQKVITGQPLASVVKEHKLVLKADLSPGYLEALPSIQKVNFTVGYSKRFFRTDEMNGRRISYGKSTGANSFYIPVYFSMDHDPDLIEGTFAEVYLIGKVIEDALVVPNTALMEEYGRLYVFVEDEDGDFQKRYVTTGSDNGEFTEILSGLNEHEAVVVTGTYNIRLSRLSSPVPAHSHNH